MGKGRSALVAASLVILSCGSTTSTTGRDATATAAGPSVPAAVVPSTAPPATPVATSKAPWRFASEPPGGPAVSSGNAAPEGTRWLEIDSFDGRPLLAAIYAPAGPAAATVLIYLHGDGGLQKRDLELGISLAQDGFLVLVPCWQGPVGRNPRALACTAGAPLRKTADDLAKEVSAIADVARTLPGARRERVVLMGHSGGGAAALLVASMGGRIDAVVVSNAPYPTGNDESGGGALGIEARWGTTPSEKIDGLDVPLLIMHGVDDRLSPATFVEAARAYQAASRERGKKVEAMYVQPGGHEFVFFPELFTPALRARFVAFIKG